MHGARETAGQPPTAHLQNRDAPLLEMRGIVKRYGPTTALNGVDFDVLTGEIHALLGENGAGKSTLMHVLSGLTRADAGDIRLDGQSVRIDSPRAARTLGIAMVHQHFTLVPAFTVAENLALDAAPGQSRSLDYRAGRAAAPALERAARLGWQLNGAARVSELSVGAQQRVEIVKALATDARLLIFDEPTAVLAGAEVEELFGVLRRLRDEGNAVILIAHKLAEILAVADRVTVLRRGNRVAACPVVETNAAQLAEWMVGAPIAVPVSVQENKREPNVADVASTAQGAKDAPGEYTVTPPALVASELIVRGDRGETAVLRLSLHVRQGEIFGIGGVDGNGQTELAEALVGLRSLQSGTITWNGRPFAPGVTPRTGYIPQDRRRAGLAVSMTVEENLILEAAQEGGFRRGPFLRRRALRRLARELIQAFDIRTSSAALPVAALSGGNQQKIVVARALRSAPEWITAVNPTRGLDVNATRFVHTQLRQARARGAAVLLLSTDLDELAALADRTAILSAGRLTDIKLDQADTTQLGLLLGGLGAAGAEASA